MVKMLPLFFIEKSIMSCAVIRATDSFPSASFNPRKTSPDTSALLRAVVKRLFREHVWKKGPQLTFDQALLHVGTSLKIDPVVVEEHLGHLRGLQRKGTSTLLSELQIQPEKIGTFLFRLNRVIAQWMQQEQPLHQNATQPEEGEAAIEQSPLPIKKKYSKWTPEDNQAFVDFLHANCVDGTAVFKHAMARFQGRADVSSKQLAAYLKVLRTTYQDAVSGNSLSSFQEKHFGKGPAAKRSVERLAQIDAKFQEKKEQGWSIESNHAVILGIYDRCVLRDPRMTLGDACGDLGSALNRLPIRIKGQLGALRAKQRLFEGRNNSSGFIQKYLGDASRDVNPADAYRRLSQLDALFMDNLPNSWNSSQYCQLVSLIHQAYQGPEKPTTLSMVHKTVATAMKRTEHAIATAFQRLITDYANIDKKTLSEEGFTQKYFTDLPSDEAQELLTKFKQIMEVRRVARWSCKDTCTLVQELYNQSRTDCRNPLADSLERITTQTGRTNSAVNHRWYILQASWRECEGDTKKESAFIEDSFGDPKEAITQTVFGQFLALIQVFDTKYRQPVVNRMSSQQVIELVEMLYQAIVIEKKSQLQDITERAGCSKKLFAILLTNLLKDYEKALQNGTTEDFLGKY